MEDKVKIVGVGWSGTEWAGEEDKVIKLKVDNQDVDVFISAKPRVLRGDVEPVTVIWEGAIDFEGSFDEFKKRYPDLYKKIEEVI